MKHDVQDAEHTQDSHHHDVVIVGIGMVGASLAALLGGAGLNVAMVDPRPEALALADVGGGQPAPRVSALTPVSQRLLEGLGAWPLIRDRRVTPYTAMQVWDGEGSGDIGFRADQAGVPVLGHIVENDVVLAALEHCLTRMPNVRQHYGQRVASLGDDPGAPQVVLDNGERLAASLVVAADGARSPLRHMAGIEINERDTGHHALVTTVRTTLPHAATARQAFLTTGPLAFLPLTVEGDSHYCSIVWSTSPQEAERLEALERVALAGELAGAFDHRLGEVEVLDRAWCFPLSQRHAQRYYQPGLVLIGDAAHSIHPLAGQGVNLGLLDAAVLAEELLQARTRGCELGEEWQLARYQRRRRGDNASMLALMDGFRMLFGARHPALTLARNLGLSSVDRLGPLKRLIMQQATGQRGRLPHSCR